MLRPGRSGGGGNLPTTGGPYNGSSPGYGSSGYGSNSNYGGYNAGGGGGSPYGGYSSTSSSNNNNNHYAYDADSFKEKPRKRNNSSGRSVVDLLWRFFKEPMAWSILAALFFFVLYIRATSSVRTFLKQLDVPNLQHATQTYQTVFQERDSLRTEVRSNREAYRKSVENSNNLGKENRKLQKQLDDYKVQPAKQADQLRMSTREEAWKQQVQLLQQATSRESRRAATEKFGPGPHFVGITVKLPHLHPEMATQTFTVEMAPLDSMPHAVHLFLEQVSHQLWDNAWFYINGPHVFQAGPQANEDELEAAMAAGQDERSMALRPFRELQLDTLSFPEYSEDYPHLPWTLGFTGRPGGPDFYINKIDNVKAHGPGGQYQHELEEFADSCFAKVIEGMGTLYELGRAPTILDEQDDYHYYFTEPIQIVKMRMVQDPRKPRNMVPPETVNESGAEPGEGVVYDDNQSGVASNTAASDAGLLGGVAQASVAELLNKLSDMKTIPVADVKGAAELLNKVTESSASQKEETATTQSEASRKRKPRKAQKRRMAEFDHMVTP